MFYKVEGGDEEETFGIREGEKLRLRVNIQADTLEPSLDLVGECSRLKETEVSFKLIPDSLRNFESRDSYSYECIYPRLQIFQSYIDEKQTDEQILEKVHTITFMSSGSKTVKRSFCSFEQVISRFWQRRSEISPGSEKIYHAYLLEKDQRCLIRKKARGIFFSESTNEITNDDQCSSKFFQNLLDTYKKNTSFQVLVSKIQRFYDEESDFSQQMKDLK